MNGDILLKLKNGAVKISGTTGSISEIVNDKSKVLTSENSGLNPLFALRLLDDKGDFYRILSTGASNIDIRQSVSVEGRAVLNMEYSEFTGNSGLALEGLRLKIKVVPYPEKDKVEWEASIINNTRYHVEYIELPCISIPDDLVGNGGDASIFWPKAEGCIIDDFRNMENRHFLNTDNKSLKSAMHYMYPGMMTMQFMSYYGKKGGLYFAAHDTEGCPKLLQYFRENDGIRMSIIIFCGVAPMSVSTPEWRTVVSLFEGDWMDAAEKYREFIETSGFRLPEKVQLNSRLPAWHRESPVVVIYPPRSYRGTGYMGPNEFFPYVNSVKYLDDMSEEFDSKIMSLLTYWEGSAPWCPPFIWPPYGGEKVFRDYTAEMHEKGHYVGVYGSGVYWTDNSKLCPEFDMTKEKIERGIDSTACKTPDQDVFPDNHSSIREGFVMCSACGLVRDIVTDQVVKIADAGVDFIQYFDQNHGGAGHICYARDHGHPFSHGKWNPDAMKEIYKGINRKLSENESSKGKPLINSGTNGAVNTGNNGVTDSGMNSTTEGRMKSIIGCESSPADYFIEDLPFNDIRYWSSVEYARFVPAFQYVFHEYCVNFMGNQAGFTSKIPLEENPDSLLFRLAYSFTCGDMLAVVMKSGGEIHWEWGMSWLIPGPPRKNIINAVRNYNAMRKGNGMKYLHYGRMMKPEEVLQEDSYVLKRNNGTSLSFPCVLYSKWMAPDGSVAQIFANFMTEPRDVAVRCRVKKIFDAGSTGDCGYLITDDENGSLDSGNSGGNAETIITIPPLSSLGILID
ncbi:MAG: DUF6259 domain-containing protein [Eubacteriales bacterium]|nr:DUF6259 domain-containing protein [Eubacteriales bacterium]